MGTSATHSPDGLLPIGIGNSGFLLDSLGRDCHPLQFLRELTQNAVEAIRRVGGHGNIVWDVDWHTHELEDLYKLCVTDDGDGMTGPEMIRLINQLSASGVQQSLTGNYGVGAKIATASRNPFGVVYLSWTAGQGAMIQLFRDPESGQYGVKQWRRSDGGYAYFVPIEDEVKPPIITEHGTRVVLLGTSETDNTVQAPIPSPSPSRWISKYLNSRYLSFPEGIVVKAREGWNYPLTDTKRNYLRTLTGQRPYLDEHAEQSGSVVLSKAIVRWWILKDEPAVANNSGFVESAGHMAALYQNELYELAAGRSGASRLQQFGITFGHHWVVLYLEPKADKDDVLTTNTARTQLLLNGEPLPWADWAAELREAMPPELATFVESKAAKSVGSDHVKDIRDRLRDIMALFHMSRYRRLEEGTLHLDADRLVRGQAGRGSTGPQGSAGEPPESERHVTGNIYAVFEKKNGPRGDRAHTDPFPAVKWISADTGTREDGLIEDRAARYLADQNLLLINADFRAFVDMQVFLRKDFNGKPGVETMIEDVVRRWFEQSLVETILGVQALCNSREWSPRDIEAALSEEALTASVMQRYHVYIATKKELGAKLGSSRK